MLTTPAASLQPRVLVVDDGLAKLDTALGRATESIAAALEARGTEVIRALSFEDGRAIVISDTSLRAVLLNWNLGSDTGKQHTQATAVLERLRERQAKVPVFLLADRAGGTRTITLDVAQMIDEFAWLLDDSADFIAGRIMAAVERYRAQLLPPYARAMRD